MACIACMGCIAELEAALVVLPDVVPAVGLCDGAEPHSTAPYCESSPFIVMYTMKPINKPPNSMDEGLTVSMPAN